MELEGSLNVYVFIVCVLGVTLFMSLCRGYIQRHFLQSARLREEAALNAIARSTQNARNQTSSVPPVPDKPPSYEEVAEAPPPKYSTIHM